MSHSKYSGCAVSLLFLPMILCAQQARENEIPLKNWTTPLYWHANRAEKAAAARPAPQLQFSTNAAAPDALTFIAITPCRLVDTRGAAAGFDGGTPFNGPSVAAAGTLTIPVQSSAEASANTMPAPCGAIPLIAEAYSFNLTVVPAAAGGVNYVTLWPAGASQPVVSTLNDVQGDIVSSAAIVPAGTSQGGVSLYNAGPAAINVILDMNGYFAAPTDLNGNTAVGAGTLAANTSGVGNTATGLSALTENTTGSYNTASGDGTLLHNTTGSNNTANGVNALTLNTSGNSNTAIGADTMTRNTTGSSNTATGLSALQSNTTGSNNTASGFEALQNNTTGGANTAAGFVALGANTTGANNTAIGNEALSTNTAGNQNTATGFAAMMSTTSGSDNAANGFYALASNTTGGYNTASGYLALTNNTTGSNNIAIGEQAGDNQPVGISNSIYLGSLGTSNDVSGTLRIGTANTSAFFVTGVNGVITGSASTVGVLIDANGQLGTVSSSRRFKEDIQDMGDASSGLLRLRPVTFRYKQPYSDGSKPLDYGLIAEEVADIYPNLVIKDKDGQVQTVQYQKLTPMLLNELQNQAEQTRQQTEEIQALKDRLAALEALLASGGH